jgi:coenzyme F420 hydrogenase subunit delta
MQLLLAMDDIPEIYTKSVLVLGCGNILFGDDGFGPAVADYINENCRVPDHAGVVNVGTSARKILFNVTLGEKRPKRVIIIDAVDCGRKPGEIFELEPENLPENKTDDFSMHQLPASNLLRELKNLCGVDVRIIACQVERIPDSVQPGLSRIMQDSVKRAADTVMGLLD